MIELVDIHHVSLAITDLEKAKYFYGTLLGFPEIERPDFDFPGAWFQIGSGQLHLIVYPQSRTQRHTDDIQTKDGHFAIRVKNYKETLNWLKEKDIKMIEKPYSQSGFSQIFCVDPDGNQIEFNVEQK